MSDTVFYVIVLAFVLFLVFYMWNNGNKQNTANNTNGNMLNNGKVDLTNLSNKSVPRDTLISNINYI